MWTSPQPCTQAPGPPVLDVQRGLGDPGSRGSGRSSARLEDCPGRAARKVPSTALPGRQRVLSLYVRIILYCLNRKLHKCLIAREKLSGNKHSWVRLDQSAKCAVGRPRQLWEMAVGTAPLLRMQARLCSCVEAGECILPVSWFFNTLSAFSENEFTRVSTQNEVSRNL